MGQWAAIMSVSQREGHFQLVQLLSHVHRLRAHGLQHTSLPCPSPTPRVYSNSCPSHQ